MGMVRALALLLVLLLAFSSAQYLDDDWLGGWTQRLGLSFSDDCQEHAGIAALWAWAESWLSGRGGKRSSGHCETKETECPPGLAANGLRVRSGHVHRGGNRELCSAARTQTQA
jgi:hypothetical protein